MYRETASGFQQRCQTISNSTTPPRVLCVSTDRSTRASVTLALVDTPVNVVIAQNAAAAVDRLQQESVDAIVVDARTIGNPSRLVDAIDSKSPETPTFVHWGEDTPDSVDVLAAVVARADETDSMARLATAVTERIGLDTAEIGAGTADREGSTPTVSESTDQAELDALVGAVRRRLVDTTSPATVEQVLFEEFTNTDRFTFSWIGEFDPGEREIVPWLTEAETIQWPMQQTFDVGTGEYPLIEQAMRTQSVQRTATVERSPDGVPFGEHAIERGVTAVAVAPLASGDEFYGVLVVYAPESITDAEQEAIAAVADTASHVLESISIRGQLDLQEQTIYRYERLVETAGDGMYVLDNRGHLMTVNDALLEMTGYSREGVLGEHLSILFDREDVAVSVETVRGLLDGDEQTTAVEMTMETKGGSTIPCEVQLAALEQNATYLGSVGVVRDITERKRDEQKLRDQNERLDAFARIVSHDLRNPLGIAQGYLDRFAETGNPDHLDPVRRGLDRMDTIVADVLAITRDGEWAADIEPVDLAGAAREAWDHVETEEATLSIDRSMRVGADRSRFLRLLENCFRNAVEHGGSAVTVRVGAFESGAEGEPRSRGFFIEDDGMGFRDGMADRLFEQSLSDSNAGIGLWVINEVASAHGWSIDTDESDAGGARFEFDVGPIDTDDHDGAFDVAPDDRHRQFDFETDPTWADESDWHATFDRSSGHEGSATFQFDEDPEG